MSGGALLVGLALLAANAFFVAAEFAMLAARRARIEAMAAEGDRGAAAALAGIRELSLMLAAAQLGITMASLGLGAVAEPALERGLSQLLGVTGLPAGLRHTLALVTALAVVVFLHLVVGEMAPKSWAIGHPERSARLLARPFRAFALVFRPFIRLLNTLANAVVRACGVEPQDELAMTHSPNDLLLLLEESARQGTLGTEEQRLLSRAVGLSGLDAEAAMIPRHDVVAVPADAGVDELEQLARDTGRSRMPVYGEDLDHVLGVLHVRDVLALTGDERATTTAGSLARQALITPESRALEELMVDMRRERQHVAIVVDEFGTVTGLVALEDLLEELIGDFEDETDRARGDAVRHAHGPTAEPVALPRRPDGALLVPGALRPDEFADQTGVELPEGDWETVAGFVIAAMDRLPEVGDVARVDDTCIEVTKLEGHRVVELAVHPQAS